MSLSVLLSRSCALRRVGLCGTISSRAYFSFKVGARILTKSFSSLSPINIKKSLGTFHRTCNSFCLVSILVSSLSEQEKEEKRKERKEMIEMKKKGLLNFGHKFQQMGGTNVVIAYFGLYVVCEMS